MIILLILIQLTLNTNLQIEFYANGGEYGNVFKIHIF